MRQLSLILIGGGDRGSSYLKFLDANPEKFQLVGLAEPVSEKREYDTGIIQDLYEYIANDNPSDSISDISVSCVSHLICFAAEEARKNNTIIDMDEYIKSL